MRARENLTTTKAGPGRYQTAQPSDTQLPYPHRSAGTADPVTVPSEKSQVQVGARGVKNYMLCAHGSLFSDSALEPNHTRIHFNLVNRTNRGTVRKRGVWLMQLLLIVY